MKTIEDMKLELLSDNSNKFMQTLIDYDIKSKDKYGSNLLHYYIMNYDSIVHPAGVIISEFIKKGLDINDKRKDVNPEKPDVPLNKNDAFQKVQKRHVQEKR